MKIRSAHLLLLLLTGLLGVVRLAGAQQPSAGDASRKAADVKCQTPVTVTGAVLAPGRFELRRPVRLNELLARAGSFTERAGKTVEITRAGLNLDCGNLLPEETKEKPVRFEIYEIDEVKRGGERANPYLRPGDFVSVPEVGIAYIVGNVAKPQRIFLKESTTVTQAIMMAGGVRPDSRLDRVRLIRPHPFADSAATEIIVDLRAIKKGRASDVLIQPHDIVEVSRKREHGWRGRLPLALPAITELPLRVIY